MMNPHHTLAARLAPDPLPDSYRTWAEYRAENRYWWHEAIADNLRSIIDTTDLDGYNVAGIASNVQANELDTERAIRQMLGWGELVLCSPQWDYAPGRWVTLADESV